MANKNAVGNALTGSTGSGTFVGATSPTLVTPVLGVATATSIDFGQVALNYYDEGSFTPTFTFATPGDLSVSYSIQNGYYTRIGKVVFFTYSCRFTPTYTTATGIPRFGGLPFTIDAVSTFRVNGIIAEATTWPTSTTMLVGTANNSQTYFTIVALGTGIASATLSTTQFPTATQRTVTVSGYYFV